MVNDAAASTVGTELPALDAGELADDALDVVAPLDFAGEDDEELDLLLPHAATAKHVMPTITTENGRLAVKLATIIASLSARQNPGTLTESWQ